MLTAERAKQLSDTGLSRRQSGDTDRAMQEIARILARVENTADGGETDVVLDDDHYPTINSDNSPESLFIVNTLTNLGYKVVVGNRATIVNWS